MNKKRHILRWLTVLGTAGLLAHECARAAGFSDTFPLAGDRAAGDALNGDKYRMALIRNRVEAGITSANGVRYEFVSAKDLATGLKGTSRSGGQIGTILVGRMDQQTRSVQVLVDGGSSPIYVPRFAANPGALNLGNYTRVGIEQAMRGPNWLNFQQRQAGTLDIASVYSSAPNLRQVNIYTQLQSLKLGK